VCVSVCVPNSAQVVNKGSERGEKRENRKQLMPFKGKREGICCLQRLQMSYAGLARTVYLHRI